MYNNIMYNMCTTKLKYFTEKITFEKYGLTSTENKF